MENQENTKKLAESLYNVLRTRFPAQKNYTIKVVKLGGNIFGCIIYYHKFGKPIAAFKANLNTQEFLSLSKKDILNVLERLRESDPNFGVSEENLNRLVALEEELIFSSNGDAEFTRNLVDLLAGCLALARLPNGERNEKDNLKMFNGLLRRVKNDIPKKYHAPVYLTP
ncbi:MAG: hypothetical protein ACOX2O_06345 [Bdellovibrionota bacterium]|jgi:hypothetical protein